MYSKDTYNSLFYNPQEKPRRPSTPLGNNNHISHSQVNFNRSFSKNAPFSPHYSHNQNMYGKGHQISKSRVSVNSSASQLEFLNSDGGQIFPEDLIFLLKNEQKNINNFKEKMEKQKSRVQNDFAILKTQIEHVLEDLKLSFQAQLDLVYKTFITKYAEVKGQVQQIRRMRKQILMANHSASPHIGNMKDTNSNSDIVGEIEKDAEHFRNYRVYSYLSEMQKQKISPILQLCTELILIGSADCPFYRSKEMSQKSKQIKSAFSMTLSGIFQTINQYIVSPEVIIQKQKEEQENTNNILNAMEQQNQYQYHQQNNNQNQNQYQHQNQNEMRNVFQQQYPNNRQSPPKFDIDQSKKSHNRPSSYVAKDQSNIKRNKITDVSTSGKLTVTNWAEQVSLRKIQRVITDHQDAILCIFFIDNKYIATGSKDKTINIYTFDGKKVTTLKGHDASICTLSTIKNSNGATYLASGSDHGCCCLILWDTRSWTISTRIQYHTAAVTCIVDLGDGENLVTGSYDKHINLFNHKKGEVISSQNNKSNITSIVMTSDKKKIVSACLENSLMIWNIIRTHNKIELELQKTVSNDSLVCILESSILRPEIVYGATRNGKIKVFNLSKDARVERTYTLAVIERQMKDQAPIMLSCSSKDKSLCMTKMDSGLSQYIRINGAFNIEFGCGIGPKVIMSQHNSGVMAILSQSVGAKQFSLFDIQLK